MFSYLCIKTSPLVFIVVCSAVIICTCAYVYTCGGQGRTLWSQLSSTFAWVWGSNSGHQAAWQVLYPLITFLALPWFTRPKTSDCKDHYPATMQDSARCADPDLTARSGGLAFTIDQLTFPVTASCIFDCLVFGRLLALLVTGLSFADGVWQTEVNHQYRAALLLLPLSSYCRVFFPWSTPRCCCVFLRLQLCHTALGMVMASLSVCPVPANAC